jgi:hypothetical protein
LLAPHLTYGNVGSLIEAVTYKRKAEVEEFLAVRFPSSEIQSTAPRIRVIPPVSDQPAAPLPLLDPIEPGSVPALIGATEFKPQNSFELRNEMVAPGPVAVAQVPAAPRFHLQFVIEKPTHNKLCRAQELLSHAVPSGDLARVFDRALDALISQIEVRKLGVSTREIRRDPTDGAEPSRYIPSAVRRAAWERDQGRCTFVSITGGRCRSRQFLELDHVEPVARGGKATLNNIRLRCRAHNQYEAERVFGREFMRQKRQEAWVARAGQDRDVGGPE